MVVHYAVGILLVIAAAVIFLGRFFAWLVEIIVRYILHIELSLGSFGLVSIHGIKVKLKKGQEISVDKIFLKSKWRQPSSLRFITICVENVSVNLNTQPDNEASIFKKPSESSHSRWLRYASSHKKTMSRLIGSVTKYVGINVSHVAVQHNGTAMINNASINCEVVEGITILGRLENDVFSCSVSLNELITKLILLSQDDIPTEPNDIAMQLSLSISIEMSLCPLQGFSLLDVDIQLSTVGLTVHEKVLSSLAEKEEISSLYLDNIDQSHVIHEGVTSSRTQGEDIMAVVFKKLLVAPKRGKLVINGTNVTFVNKEQRKLTLGVKRTSIVNVLHPHSSDIPNCSLEIDMSDVTLNGWKSCKMCTLNRLGFGAKLTGTSKCVNLSSSLSIESFHSCYVHDEWCYWFENFKHGKLKRGITPLNQRPANLKKKDAIEILPKELELCLSITAVDCSTSLFLANPIGDGQPDCCAVLTSLTTELEICQSFQNSREFSVYTKLENSYVYMDILGNCPEQSESQRSHHSIADNPGLLPSSCKHHWGRILAAGSLALKLNTVLTKDQETLHVNVEGDASSLAFEWSHDVCRALISVTSKVEELIPSAGSKPRESRSNANLNFSSVVLESHFQMVGVNVFYLGSHDGGIDSLMSRVDDITLESSWSNKLQLTICNMKVCRMFGMKMEPFCCRQSLNSFLEIPNFKLSIVKEKVTSVSIAQVVFSWDPELHMALNDRVSELAEDGNNLKMLLKPPRHQPDSPEEQVVQGSKDVNIKFDVVDFKLHMQTSCSTSFGVAVKCAYGFVGIKHSKLAANAEQIHLLFNGQKTVEFENFSIVRSSEIQELASLRQSFKNLRTSSNVAYVVEVATTEIHFAYEFDFAASRDQLVNVIKMLKALHRKRRDSSHVETLPPDLWLQFKNVTFQMDDSPFEVKLRDNYALLLDEYEERREREDLLENRLNEIRKRPGNQLTVKKEEQLYESLQRKSAEIYIKRSKALYSESPMRTALLRWTFKGLDLRVLADELYHGKEKVVMMMRELDHDRYVTICWFATIFVVSFFNLYHVFLFRLLSLVIFVSIVIYLFFIFSFPLHLLSNFVLFCNHLLPNSFPVLLLFTLLYANLSCYKIITIT